MAIPTNRDEFIQYCLRQLGEPVFQVNVALEQADDRVDEALFRFHERHYHGSEEVFILHPFSQAELDQGYILLEPDIVSVTDVMLPTPNSGIFSVEYQLQLENLFSTSLVSNYGDMTYYYMTQMNVTLINRFFSPVRQYVYNPLSQRLVIAGGLKNTEIVAGGVIIRGFKKIYGDAVDAPPIQHDSNSEDAADSNDGIDLVESRENIRLLANIWADRWLQNYATALIKKNWGQNLMRFQQVQLLGGITMNGSEIYAEALQEIEKLENELYTTYELPPAFIMG